MQEEHRNLFDGDNFDDLIARYEEMLKAGETYYFDVEDFEQILDYYIDVNHLGKALRAVRYAFKLHPHAISLMIKKAQILLKDQNPQRALSTLNNIEYLESSNNEFYVTRGHANVMLGNIPQAKKEYSKALSLLTDSDDAVDLLQNIAHTLQLADNYRLSLKYLLKAQELDPSNIFVIQDLAYCYEKMDDPIHSLTYYHKYLEIDPFSESVWYSVGKTNQELGRLEEAIEAFEFTLAINPKSADAIYEIATLYEDSFQFEKAIDYYKNFLFVDDIDKDEIYFSIGNCYNYLDDFENALSYYKKALKSDSYNAGVHHGIATILFKQKNYWDALFYAKRATIIDDEEYIYFVLYGKIASALNLKNESIIAFEEAVNMKPELLSNWALLVDEFIKYEYYTNAINKLDECLEFHNDSAYVYFRLAAVNYLENNMKCMSKYFREGMKMDQKQSNEFFKLCPEAKESREISKIFKNLSYKR